MVKIAYLNSFLYSHKMLYLLKRLNADHFYVSVYHYHHIIIFIIICFLPSQPGIYSTPNYRLPRTLRIFDHNFMNKVFVHASHDELEFYLLNHDLHERHMQTISKTRIIFQ